MVAKSKEVGLVMIMGEPSINFCMTLLVLFLLTISFHSQSRIEAVPTYSKHSCPNTSTLTINTPYQSNYNHLLAYLSSNATHNIEFYKATVYGLYLCHGDMSLRLRRWSNQRLNNLLSSGERCGGLVRRVHVEIHKPLYIFQHGS